MGRCFRRRKRKVSVKSEFDIDRSIINLLKWLKLKNNHVKIVPFASTGRGVLTKKKIEINEELAAVPLDHMITLDDVYNCPNLTFLQSLTVDTHTKLAVFLLLQRHLDINSFYHPYIEVLPTTHSTLWYCTEREKELLPNWLFEMVDDRVTCMEAMHAMLIEGCLNLKCDHCGCTLQSLFSYDDFVWAWTTVNTRSVYFEGSNCSGGVQGGGQMAMAPFLDLYNHSNTANVEAFISRDRNVYILKTKKGFKKNEQVFIKYGSHSNLVLLLDYGFVSENRDHEVISFTFDEILMAAKKVGGEYGDVTNLKYKFIQTHNLNANLSKGKDGFSWNCDGLLYVLVTKDSDLKHLLSKTYSSIVGTNEKHLINKIKTELMMQKHSDLTSELTEMEKIYHCSAGFCEAKKLMHQYIEMLKSY